MDSALYQGNVMHQRFTPTQHKFVYNIYLFWLKLSELDELAKLPGFNVDQKGLLEFRQSDYVHREEGESLSAAVLRKMNALYQQQSTSSEASAVITGDVFFIGQPRMLGLYFSPVNFYFVHDGTQYTYMLAEVSNTPWHERHYYLVDLLTQADTDKVFHVSPFNPIDMVYKWHIAQPDKHFRLTLSCHQETKHMVAGLDLKRVALNATSLRQAKRAIPSMTIKTVIGIYWEAVKLFIKRTPFYGHPGGLRSITNQTKE
ncbi:MAG: DUF1365 domain-containing protein [Glaciecola sp.]|jgi:DUF1365 family protein